MQRLNASRPLLVIGVLVALGLRVSGGNRVDALTN